MTSLTTAPVSFDPSTELDKTVLTPPGALQAPTGFAFIAWLTNLYPLLDKVKTSDTVFRCQLRLVGRKGKGFFFTTFVSYSKKYSLFVRQLFVGGWKSDNRLHKFLHVTWPPLGVRIVQPPSL